MNLISRTDFFIRVKGKDIIPIDRGVIDFFHLCIVLDGELTYLANDKEIVLKKNDALILVAGTDRYRFPQPNYTEFILFNYLPSSFNEITSNTLFKNVVNHPILSMLNAYPFNYFHARKYNRTEEKENLRIRNILHNIFNCILLELTDSLKYTTQNTHVLNTVKYINDNITKPLTLSSVCSEMHLSKEYIARIFKKEMGQTVTDYINTQKLAMAKTMISADDFTLREISEKLGYSNYNYFSRIFKKQYGITPAYLKRSEK